MASTSTDPRLTGNAPTVSTNLPSGLIFHSESFAMNRTRRCVTHPTTNVSRFDRWIGAIT